MLDKIKSFVSFIFSDRYSVLMLLFFITYILLNTIIQNNYFEIQGFFFGIFYMIRNVLLLIWSIIIVFSLYRSKISIFRSTFLPFILYRLSIYIFILIMIISISDFIFSNFGFSTTNADSARYFLSALIQSEASIIAILITLSLIAVQQNVPYSSRTVKLFKSVKTNPDFYIIIAIYMSSIFYHIWLLKQVNVLGPESVVIVNFGNTMIFQSFENHLRLSISIAVFAFISLLPYTLNTLDLLNPLKTIEILARNINNKNLSNSILKESNLDSMNNFVDEMRDYIDTIDYGLITNKLKYYKKNHVHPFSNIIPETLLFNAIIAKEGNPYQPLIDIIHSSLLKSEFETSRNGLSVISKTVKELFKKEFIGDSFMLLYLNFELTKIGNLAIEKKDEYCVDQILLIIYNNGILTMNKYQEITKVEAIKQIEYLGKMAVSRQMDEVVYRAQILLFYFSMNAINMNIKEAIIKIMNSIREIGLHSIKQNKMNYAENSTKILNHIVLIAEEEELEYIQEIKDNLQVQ